MEGFSSSTARCSPPSDRDHPPVGGAGGAAQPPRDPRRPDWPPAHRGVAPIRSAPRPVAASDGRAAAAARPRVPQRLGRLRRRGHEYVVVLGEGQSSPAPWINVVANSRFGFCVSESGSGYSWAENSRENQLTPWSNDPVADPPVRCSMFEMRKPARSGDRQPCLSGIRPRRTWPATAPAISEFEHTSRGIALHLHQTVPARGSNQDLPSAASTT